MYFIQLPHLHFLSVSAFQTWQRHDLSQQRFEAVNAISMFIFEPHLFLSNYEGDATVGSTDL